MSDSPPTTLEVRRPPVGSRIIQRERRAAARLRDLSALLQRRTDLQGVHPPADLAVESVLTGV